MKKNMINGLLAVAALGLTMSLAACNNEKCCDSKDKATMKEGSMTEASAKSACCKDGAAKGECSKDGAKAGCCKNKAATQN